MKMKSGIDMDAFLAASGRCADEVLLKTDQGDVLNLKSQLSRFVFAAMTTSHEFLKDAEVVCSTPEDKAILAEFLEE